MTGSHSVDFERVISFLWECESVKDVACICGTCLSDIRHGNSKQTESSIKQENLLLNTRIPNRHHEDFSKNLSFLMALFIFLDPFRADRRTRFPYY